MADLRSIKDLPLGGRIVAAVAVVLAIAAVNKVVTDDEEPARAADPLPSMARVTYYVEGTAKAAAMTFQTPTGTEQVDAVVPLVKSSDNTAGLEYRFARGAFVHVSAQLQGERGELTCRIEVDGRVISENTSSGAYSIVTCDGTA